MLGRESGHRVVQVAKRLSERRGRERKRRDEGLFRKSTKILLRIKTDILPADENLVYYQLINRPFNGLMADQIISPPGFVIDDTTDKVVAAVIDYALWHSSNRVYKAMDFNIDDIDIIGSDNEIFVSHAA